jgi:hypothetical protein
LIATIALLVLSWIGNAGLPVAVINFSKDLKVEGGSLKDAKDGGAVSTESQKNVYEVTLLSKSASRQHEHEHEHEHGHEHEHEHEHSGAGTNESSTVVAQVTCASVMEAISSIEKGNDGSLVKMDLGDGKFWEPRMSAAFYHLHDDSFSIEQIFLDDQRDVSYDVMCEIPKEDCENAPGSLCDVVSSERSALTAPSTETSPRAFSIARIRRMAEGAIFIFIIPTRLLAVMSSLSRTTTAEGQNRGPSALHHSRDSCRAGRVRFQCELSHAALRD